MKKIYNAPELRVVTVNTVKMFSGSLGSLEVNSGSATTVSKGSAWAREDNSWDIWGSDEGIDD